MGRIAGIARREKKRAEMELLSSTEISAAGGVARDFRGRPGKRQITLLSAIDWQHTCEELGADVHWTARRANLLIEDLALPKEAGRVLVIGDVRLETTVEVDPCARMDEACPGLRRALEPDWRGGVACRVIQGGRISIGDSVTVVE